MTIHYCRICRDAAGMHVVQARGDVVVCTRCNWCIDRAAGWYGRNAE